ncbi:MAG: hypothetical protein CEO19_144 [Parcubacteria group bacterium Gr01-1014_73]|nr:MAG: hypothetical protein CEO19_144 [Parcubacteria group bacterium Gr01-1014_73]
MKKSYNSVRNLPLRPVKSVYVGFNRPPHREIIALSKRLKGRLDELGIAMILPGARTIDSIGESIIADGYWQSGFGDAAVLFYHQNSADVDLFVQLTQTVSVGVPSKFFCFRQSVCAPHEIEDVVKALNVAFEDHAIGVSSVVDWLTSLKL